MSHYKAILPLFSFVFLMALSPINRSTFSKVAIKGYDTVAYHTQKKAQKGLKKYKHKWKGAHWLFASQKHLELFQKNPEKYAPQFGGYCAYAVSQNTTAGVDPRQWDVSSEGKLYLNYNAKIQNKWLENKEEFIQEAEKNWPSLIK